jgi:hypothetical protein
MGAILVVLGGAAALVQYLFHGRGPESAAAARLDGEAKDAGAKDAPAPPPPVAAAQASGVCRVAAAPVPLPADAAEASGVAAGRRTAGVLWTHNDSGDPLLLAVGTDGSARGRVRVDGASVEDWEDVAAGPCPAGSCLYVADIGDNKAERQRITVYRVAEPAPADPQTARAEALHATYPDGAHDAEALFVLPDGGVYVVTKGETGPIALYRFPQPLRPGATARLEKVRDLQDSQMKRRERITGASASADGRWVALRTLETISIYPAREFVAGTAAQPLRIDLRGLNEAQGEGVGFGADGTVYLTSEGGRKNKPGTLARLTCELPG